MTADGARSAGVITATQLMKVLLAAASLLVLSRLLGPTEFGLYAMIIAVLGFGEIFRDLGLSLAATQASSLSPGQRTNLFWVNCGVGLTLTALACAASPLIAQFYGRPGITLPMCAAASTFAFNGAAAQIRVDLVRAGRFGAIGVSEVLSQAVGLLTAIGLIVFAHLSLWALIAQPVLQALLVFVFMARAARWRFALPRRGVPIKEFVSFGSTLLLVQLVSYGSSNLDKVLIGRFFGATTLGYYSRAYVLFQQPMQQALAPFTGLAVSRLSLTRDDPARRLGQLLRVQELVNWVGLLGYALMLGTSGALLEVLLGPQWAGAVPYFQIL